MKRGLRVYQPYTCHLHSLKEFRERKKAKETKISFGAGRLEEACRCRSSNTLARDLWVKGAVFHVIP